MTNLRFGVKPFRHRCYHSNLCHPS